MAMEHSALDEVFLPRKKLKQLIAGLPTPFFLYDEAGIRESIRDFLQAFSWCPGHRQIFPLRQLPLDGMARILLEEGCGVSCCTDRELRQAADWGFFGESLVYEPMYPSVDGLALASSLGATVSVDNNISAAVCLEQPIATASLVFNPGGKVTLDGTVLCRAERSKRGMGLREILEYAPYLHRTGIQRLGLEVHLTQQVLDPVYYGMVLSLLQPVIEELERLHTPIAFCNLGGGPGLSFFPSTPHADAAEWGRRTERCASQLPYQIPIWTAADRLFTGPHCLYFSRVLCVKRAHRQFMVLDSDAAQFPRLHPKGRYHLSLLTNTERGNRQFYDVVGCHPDETGRFAEYILLPEPSEDEICIVHEAGVAPPGPGGGYYLYRQDGTLEPMRGLLETFVPVP